MNRTPQPSDADLVLKLYDLRRESVMRQARSWVASFAPKSYDEIKKVLAADHPQNAYYRQVTSYWEMASSFVNRGILHPDVFADACGEALFVFAKFEPFVKDVRANYSPTSFAQVEKAIAENPSIREKFAIMRERVQGKK